ncbi:MAG: DUF502 domain-containing protein [Proteobacteria bacterium]|nr:DUF502 domain-containing protein [Pseudomonadota bacterium]
MLKYLGRILLKGLVTILPIGLTLYLIYWLGVTLESVLSGPLHWVIDDRHYLPGMGLVAGLAVLFVMGMLVNAYLVRRVLRHGEQLVLKVPLVRTLYSAFRDLAKLVNTDRKSDMQSVVVVRCGDLRLLGFVTQEVAELPGIDAGQALVAVYLPMSYQIGGYTVYVPRDHLEPTTLTVETAMRIVLTGGLQNN